MSQPRHTRKQLRLRPTLRQVSIPGVGVLLLDEAGHHLFDSPLYQRLLALLQTPGDHDSLAQQLADSFHPLEVFYALEQLQQLALLSDDLHAAQIQPVTLSLAALGDRDPRVLAELLRGAGVQVLPEATLRVLLVDSYLNPQLDAELQGCHAAGITVLPLCVGHQQSWLGPSLAPDSRPCWACLRSRLWDNHPVENFLQRRGIPIPPPPPPPAAALNTALGLILLSLAGLARSHQPAVLQRLDHSDGSLHRHPVLARPHCPHCGDPGHPGAALAIQLVSRPTGFSMDGGYRLEDPEQSYARLADRVDPITGLVTRLGPLPGRNRPGRPVYAATHPLHPVTTPGPEDFQQISLGKGQTPAQARMSALGEALERWSARYREDLPVRRASLNELGEPALAPASLLNFSDHQYRQRDSLNAGLTDWRQHIPRAYPADARLDWTPIWSLSEQRQRWLPSGFCYSQYPTPPAQDYVRFSSNGHAAGQCLEEAILQGFLELVERDAVAIWWYNRLPRPAVDLDSVEHPYPRQLLADYQRLGWRLWCLDLSTDLGLPVVVALAGGPTPGELFLGFGCHLEARLALLRALTELNQLFEPDQPGRRPWDPAALTDPQFLYPDPAQPPRRLTELAGQGFDDLAAAVRHCVTQAASRGLQTLVLDQTRPETGLCAVKVVVPGLRHFWPRLGPGRLFQVPVALGWRDTALGEHELNPLGLYL